MDSLVLSNTINTGRENVDSLVLSNTINTGRGNVDSLVLSNTINPSDPDFPTTIGTIIESINVYFYSVRSVGKKP